MIRGAVRYKDRWLAPNSQGFELHAAGKLKELDELIKRLDQAEKVSLGLALHRLTQQPQ